MFECFDLYIIIKNKLKCMILRVYSNINDQPFFRVRFFEKKNNIIIICRLKYL